ncbi:MAG: DUF4276 family protein [Lachnospiraceae bacterium]|nr:DUF4276 family protein [Lachnospiraceae bacterium]
MKKIFVVTEGQSETNFVNKVMVPYFSGRCILIPNTVITKTDNRHGRMHKGGAVNYEQIRNTLVKTLANASKNEDSYVTTMFDFYCLPKDVPGAADVEKGNNPYEKVEHIEREIRRTEKYDERFFFPYIELHEFEAMLFSDITKLEEIYFEYDLTALKECAKMQSNPELINGGKETAPSKRIMNCIKGFDKAGEGVQALEKIGIENIAQKCPHFSKWVKHIEERIQGNMEWGRIAPK